jgi:uncharacterized membrane protein YphA (DoxX/SURF4 family)
MARQDSSLLKLNKLHIFVLVFLRLLIGWHFFYEGLSKLLMPGWTSAAYLENSRWLFSGFFHSIAGNPSTLFFVDQLNMWGLVLIGAGLMLGLFTRLSSIFGILLLALYYIANPPLTGFDFGIPTEGHYLVVNKNLIEMVALGIIALFPTGMYFGLDRLALFHRPGAAADGEQPDRPAAATTVSSPGRREVLKSLATLPLLGAVTYGAFKRQQYEKLNAITGATIKVSDTQLKDLKGELPKGKIKGIEISRIIMGGNLIGGWAHSRDLIYVSSLFKAYNTDKKIFETLQLAEKAGINSINITGSQFPLINKYKRIFGSKMHVICQVSPTKDDLYGEINYAMDNGVSLVQIKGSCSDFNVRDGHIDVLAKAIDYIRAKGFPAGLGAHSIQALQGCDKAGIIPDFYMKTLHHDKYWSAIPKEYRIPFSVDGEKSLDHNKFHDNMFCLFPDETIEFFKNKTAPVIGFKVLAGGAIDPKDGFKFALENGADFLCVGMFDWQVVDDVNIAIETLAASSQRQRPWCA